MTRHRVVSVNTHTDHPFAAFLWKSQRVPSIEMERAHGGNKKRRIVSKERLARVIGGGKERENNYDFTGTFC